MDTLKEHKDKYVYFMVKIEITKCCIPKIFKLNKKMYKCLDDNDINKKFNKKFNNITNLKLVKNEKWNDNENEKTRRDLGTLQYGKKRSRKVKKVRKSRKVSKMRRKTSKNMRKSRQKTLRKKSKKKNKLYIIIKCPIIKQ